MIKNRLKSILERCGIRIVQKNHPAYPLIRIPGGSPFNWVVHDLLQQKQQDLHVIQIGANDGSRFDPLSPWLETEDWHCLLIEPLPEFTAKLKAKYQSRSKISILQSAVGCQDEKLPLYRIDPATKNLPDWASGSSTLDQQRAQDLLKSLHLDETSLIEETVTVMSWHSILKHYGSISPDLVVMDTEGYDLMILNEILKTDQTPAVIHFEHACATNDERLKLYAQLLNCGYELSTCGPDTTAWRNS